MKKLLIVLFCFLASPAFSQQLTSQQRDDGPQLKAMQGTYSKVLSSEIIVKTNCVECGFNDLSFPKQGFYKKETIQYDKWEDGKLVRSWTETKETFMYCHEPY